MSWRFVLHGQPPSVNHLYENAWKVDRGGREYKGRRLTDVAVKYRDDAILVIRSARPSRWAPEGQVRILWDIFLAHDIDCDNAMKVVHDAIQKATEINDSRYLPCVMSKTNGLPLRQARIEIVILEASGSLLSDLAIWESTRIP